MYAEKVEVSTIMQIKIFLIQNIEITLFFQLLIKKNDHSLNFYTFFIFYLFIFNLGVRKLEILSENDYYCTAQNKKKIVIK